MKFSTKAVQAAYDAMQQKLDAGADGAELAKSDDMKQLLSDITSIPTEKRATYGKEVNQLKQFLLEHTFTRNVTELPRIDVTSPLGVGMSQSDVVLTSRGTVHPVTLELKIVTDIFMRMGFSVVESRLLDDDYHMFGSLNFPDDHPARDDYDTFMTDEGLIAPAHTSTMQNRVLSGNKHLLEAGEPIQFIIPDRVFRNEDLDARHEHTFTQLEGIYVDREVTVGNLIATLKTFLQTYYQQELEVKTQPFYFPFTEPSLEFALSCPFCQKKGCSVCSHEGWIELLGCGMIHPNVLREADIDPDEYCGFAWGMGIERLIMMKHNIEDVRHFNAARLSFLEQFKGGIQ